MFGVTAASSRQRMAAQTRLYLTAQKAMADRRCKQIFAVLSEYLDGELPPGNCRELERHLQGCKACLAYLETLKATVQACRKYRVTKFPCPSPRVRAALREAARKSRTR